MPAFSPLLLICYFVTLAAAVCSRGRRRLLAAGALAFTVLLICYGLPRPSRGDELEVAFLDVGHGDACVMLAPTGETMLVDAGESARGWDAGRNVVLPFLRERGVRAVDRAVISHGDGDHWGGLAYVADHLRVKELVLPAGVPLGPLGELVPALKANGTTVRWVEAGDTLTPLGELESVVIHPSGRFEELHGSELGEDLNDRSLVLRVKYGDVVFLMTGDVEKVAEEWLVGGNWLSGVGTPGWSCNSDGPRPGGDCDGPALSFRGSSPGSCAGSHHSPPWATPLDCTVIKVPHHGSNTSSSPEFVLRTSPLVAVVSCGPKERFNLPKPVVLERYRAHGITPMMTVRDGAVIVKTDGRGVTVTPYVGPAEAFEVIRRDAALQLP